MDYLDSDSLYWIFTQVIRNHYYRTRKLLDKIGVYPGQPPLLFIIGSQEGQSQKELADRLKIKAATITVMLGRMERSGMVERQPDPNDQRISRVYLTEKGKKLRQEAIDALLSVEEECFKNITSEEKLLLRRLLMQIRDNLASYRDEGPV
jgi:DNA-binding MarR family transcriptional regulator